MCRCRFLTAERLISSYFLRSPVIDNARSAVLGSSRIPNACGRQPRDKNTMPRIDKARLRSKLWFDNPENPGMTALYLERYLNYGLTQAELQSGKPIIGIAQTGSDLS